VRDTDPTGQVRVPPPGGGGRLFQISCARQKYIFDDGYASGSLQYQCRSSPQRLNWGFQLHSNVQVTVASLVNEYGILYQVNYGHLMKNQPHLKPAWYLFHGGIAPVHRTDTVDFIDELKFVIFGNTQVTVYFEGTVQVVS